MPSYSTAATQLSPMHQWRRTHGVMTHLQIRVPDTPQTKHMFCELVPVKTLIASHNKQEKKKKQQH